MIQKRRTYTSMVEEFMGELDDFTTVKQISQATILEHNEVDAVLCSFKKVGAADRMFLEGKVYWYLTPGTDRRSFKVEMRTPETKPRRTRRIKRGNKEH